MDSILREMPAASGGAGPAPSEVQSQGQVKGTAETSPLTDVQVHTLYAVSELASADQASQRASNTSSELSTDMPCKGLSRRCYAHSPRLHAAALSASALLTFSSHLVCLMHCMALVLRVPGYRAMRCVPVMGGPCAAACLFCNTAVSAPP